MKVTLSFEVDKSKWISPAIGYSAMDKTIGLGVLCFSVFISFKQ
jgi:hypothetical protein